MIRCLFNRTFWRVRSAAKSTMVAAVTLVLFGGASQASMRFTEIGQWSEPCMNVAAVGNTIYAVCQGSGYSLRVLDATDPNNILQIGSCTIPSSGWVKLHGNYAWIAGYAGGLHIVDVSTPTNPVKVATFDTPGTARDVAFFDHYACVADGDYGLQVIDVSDPANPIQAGSYNTNGYAYAVAVSGNCAFVADGNKGLKAISLVDPVNPTLIGSYQTSSDSSDIEISGSFAYVKSDSVLVFDITNPSAPVQVGKSTYVGDGGLTMSGNYIYVFGTDIGVVFDVSQPDNPVLVGRAPYGGNLAVSGDRACTVSHSYLKIMQIAQSTQCIVLGYVRDPLGNPLNGIGVSTDPGGYTTTTNYSGQYELDYVDPATYTVTASGSGWAPATTTLTCSNGNTVQASDIVLSFGSMAGRVKDDLANPIGEATVSCSGSSAVTTYPNGNYYIGDLAPGYHNVTVSKLGHVSISENIYVSGNETTNHDFTLIRTGTLTGLVKDNLGRSISGISIGASPFFGYGAVSDSTGKYTLPNIPPGTYSFTASSSSWTSVTQSNIVVNAGETVSLDFTLQLGTMSGTVKDGLGNVVADASVSSSSGGLSATTDSNGAFLFTDVSPGGYQFTISKSGYQQLTSSVGVTGGQTTTKSFVITAYASVSGTVTDSEGKPISGALLVAQYSCHTYTATTDSTGHYIMHDLLPILDASVIASKTGYGTVMKKLAITEGQAKVCNFRLADAIALDLVSSTSISAHLYNVAVHDGVAAVGTSLNFIDVTNPATPVKLSTFGYASGEVIVSNMAYVAAGNAGLQILSISNPSVPSLIGAYDTSGEAKAVDVVGNHAYLADGSSGLQIVDISSPANPVRVGGYDTTGSAVGVDVSSQGYAFVADASSLQIINVQNPASPIKVGHYSVPNCGFNDVALSGDYAYVTDSYIGLFLVIDISVPANPVLVGMGYVPAGSRPAKVSLSGKYAYVGAGYYGGVMIYDVSTPTDPCLVTQYANYRANDIAESNGYLYTADYNGSLVILSQENLKVTGITPQRAANSETMLATSLTGLGFNDGDQVKLSRAGCPDIVASNVSIVDAGHVNCTLNIAGAQPGLWTVVVTNADSVSCSLANTFEIVLPESAPCVAAVNRSVNDPIMDAAYSRWQFKLFGKVTQTTSDGFWIEDGSGVSIKVRAPDYSQTRIRTNKYVAVTGTLDVLSDTKALMSTDAKIDVLR